MFLRDTCHREIHEGNIRDKRFPREACFALGNVKVEKDSGTFNVEQDEDTLVEERPQIERGTMFHRDTRHRAIHQRNIRDKWFPREACFVLGDVKVENVIVAFREEEEEDILVEEGPQIERGTVFLRGTCHCDSHQRNSRDKRLPREACFDQGVVKVGKDIVTFIDEKDEDALVEEGPQIERGLVFLTDTCQREIHQRTFVTSGSRVKRVLPWALTKWTKHIVTFNEDEDEDILVEDGPQIDRGTVFLWDTCHREIYQRNNRGKRFPREACFDLVDVEVEKDIVTFNEREDEDILVEEGPQI